MRLIDADKLMQRICDDMAHIDNIDVNIGDKVRINVNPLYVDSKIKRVYE